MDSLEGSPYAGKGGGKGGRGSVGKGSWGAVVRRCAWPGGGRVGAALRAHRVHAAAEGLDEALEHLRTLSAQSAGEAARRRSAAHSARRKGSGLHARMRVRTRCVTRTRLRRTNCSTLSSSAGGPGRRPMAPRPARILPTMDMRSNTGKSAGPPGTGRSRPSQNTKRGASGSPNTSSSFSPASTAARRMGIDGCARARGRYGRRVAAGQSVLGLTLQRAPCGRGRARAGCSANNVRDGRAGRVRLTAGLHPRQCDRAPDAQQSTHAARARG
jgi:hypothetical protein